VIELHAGAPGSQQTRDWPWNSVNKGTGREPLRAGERGGGGGSRTATVTSAVLPVKSSPPQISTMSSPKGSPNAPCAARRQHVDRVHRHK